MLPGEGSQGALESRRSENLTSQRRLCKIKKTRSTSSCTMAVTYIVGSKSAYKCPFIGHQKYYLLENYLP